MTISKRLLALCLVLTLAANGCRLWVVPDQRGGDQSAAEVDSGADDGSATESKIAEISESGAIKAGGYRVLVLLETDFKKPMADGYVQAIYGPEVRSWLKGNSQGFRFFDQHTPIGKEADQFWKDAAKLPHGDLPWLFIFNGKPSYTGPLPQSPAEVLKLLKARKP